MVSYLRIFLPRNYDLPFTIMLFMYLFDLNLTLIRYGVMLYSRLCSYFTLNLTMIIFVSPLPDVTFTAFCVASLVVIVCNLLTLVCCLSKSTVTAAVSLNAL